MKPAVIAVTETNDPRGEENLVGRILGGEVIVVRKGLQTAALFDRMLDDSKAAVRGILDDELAAQVFAQGFENIHKFVPPASIPEVTEAIYAVAQRNAADYLRVLMKKIFGRDQYYYESVPNVRFHIPFSMAKAHARLFAAYSEKRGDGKVTSHGPHRDSWLDCPDNGVNIWIALGPVRRGNGLTIYVNDYNTRQRYTPTREVTDEEKLSRPANFELDPGDFVLFHTDHLHGSELNWTDETRFVISFRVTFDKPRFPNGHYHAYHHAGLAAGSLKPISSWPAYAQMSFVRSTAQRVVGKLGRHKPAAPEPRTAPGPVRASDIAVGAIVQLDQTSCITRLEDGRIVAFSRRCPHKGADLANGFVSVGRIVCPWHNLPFDPTTGAAACTGLPPLHIRTVEINEGIVRAVPSRAGLR